MGQVTTGRRIKTATKDHAAISMIHLRLHGGTIVWMVVAFCLLGIGAFIVVGITRPNTESEWEVTFLQKGPGCS